MKSYGSPMVADLLTVTCRQAREAPHALAHGLVVLLDE